VRAGTGRWRLFWAGKGGDDQGDVGRLAVFQLSSGLPVLVAGAAPLAPVVRDAWNRTRGAGAGIPSRWRGLSPLAGYAVGTEATGYPRPLVMIELCGLAAAFADGALTMIICGGVLERRACD
jgi:hypothetical protein